MCSISSFSYKSWERPKNSREKPAASSSSLWVEKYRPQKIDDIHYQQEVIQTIKASLACDNIPHMLFYGPPGTGKTSTILALSNQLFGNYTSERILELNASDERGIKIVRGKIKSFAKTTMSPHEGIPNYKLIILDEADTMTHEAQTALRRCIEIYSQYTRFCIICNYVSRIIEPILSRCAIFRFHALPNGEIIKKMEHISAQEQLSLSYETLVQICQVTRGDLRKAISILQTISYFGTETNQNIINDINGNLPSSVVNQFMKDIEKSKKPIDIINAVTEIIASAYAVRSLFRPVIQKIIESSRISDHYKSKLCLEMSNADVRLLRGSDEWVELLLVAELMYIAIQNSAKQKTTGSKRTL